MYKMAVLGKIWRDSINVVLLTGSGLKDLNAVQSVIEIPVSIQKIDDLIIK
jgi:threonine synthase